MTSWIHCGKCLYAISLELCFWSCMSFVSNSTPASISAFVIPPLPSTSRPVFKCRMTVRVSSKLVSLTSPEPSKSNSKSNFLTLAGSCMSSMTWIVPSADLSDGFFVACPVDALAIAEGASLSSMGPDESPGGSTPAAPLCTVGGIT
eukprot:CAMPEP_0115743486 /NCGR_PEP_ID=MMETSP0272-20121206/91096_1 /TAXON_ID=71861 /ORGANISM="Scrippsiella trochoidea, Strain CCMP3099" /LENGTH=146 /DNA_ID=CAMNT_0003188297 /DNA_START=97 /DNA_END=533 /DNA_ORIENTATION=-